MFMSGVTVFHFVSVGQVKLSVRGDEEELLMKLVQVSLRGLQSGSAESFPGRLID